MYSFAKSSPYIIMNWFNDERRKSVLTFPVGTVNLLDDGRKYVDQEWFDFTATQEHSLGAIALTASYLVALTEDKRQRIL